MNDYGELVSSIQKGVAALEIGLYNQISCHGLYRNGKIYIEKTLSTRQKKNVSAEGHGHYQTSAGIILNQNCTKDRKQELKARDVALEQLVTLDNLIRCSETGLSNHYSCTEPLGIDVETLRNVITYYRQEYGATYLYKGRVFEFRDYPVMVLNTGLT